MQFEMPAISDKHIQKIFEYLRSLKWTDEQIAQFIDYISK